MMTADEAFDAQDYADDHEDDDLEDQLFRCCDCGWDGLDWYAMSTSDVCLGCDAREALRQATVVIVTEREAGVAAGLYPF